MNPGRGIGPHKRPGSGSAPVPGAQSGVITVHPLYGIPEVEAGDNLSQLLHDALTRAGLALADGDVLAISSKVISKAHGLRETSDGRSGTVLRHSSRVVAERRTATGTTRVVEALAGPVMAGAGIDGSNTGPDERLLLLPEDPDRAAYRLHQELLNTLSTRGPVPHFGVVVTDTAGRPWRAGQTDFALGASGVLVLDDLRGSTDSDGRPLGVTARAVADEIAAAADLVKGKAAGVPAALVRGLVAGTVTDPVGPGAQTLVRTGPDDWFALGTTEAVRSALGVPPGSEAANRVGVACVAPEEHSARLARAIRLALHGDHRSTVNVGLDGQLTVHAETPYAAGRISARLEVALASEALDSITISWPGGTTHPEP